MRIQPVCKLSKVHSGVDVGAQFVVGVDALEGVRRIPQNGDERRRVAVVVSQYLPDATLLEPGVCEQNDQLISQYQ